MPQSERSIILKKILQWLLTQENGATTQAIISYTKEEICEMGASNTTIKKYIEDLSKALMIEYKHPFWRISKKGSAWLDRHPI